MRNDDWIIIYRATGKTNADIVAGRLESEGIPTRLEYEAVGRIYAITIDGLGEVRVLVPAEFFEKSQQILASEYEEGDLPWE